jgi:hypothetical protein
MKKHAVEQNLHLKFESRKSVESGAVMVFVQPQTLLHPITLKSFRFVWLELFDKLAV